MTATMIAMTISALGKPVDHDGAHDRLTQEGLAVPPGVFRINSATPSQTKSIASVTTMSGTRVMTISTPFRTPSACRPPA
jgi:hypothetical protein